MSVRKKCNDMKKAAAAAALARGEKDFYLSWPCVNGHRGPWNSKTERCRKCMAATRAKADAKYAKTAKGKATLARAYAKRAKTGRRLRKHKAYRASPTGQFDSMVGEVLDMADADLSDVDRKEI